jgi:hypothetical protein
LLFLAIFSKVEGKGNKNSPNLVEELGEFLGERKDYFLLFFPF